MKANLSRQGTIHASVRSFFKGTVASIPLLVAANGAWAQDASAEPKADQQTSAAVSATPSEIVVTGSRLRSIYTAPTPVQVISDADFAARGATNVATVLQELPAVSGTRSAAASNGVRTQTPGQNFVELRSLGSQRTLVLVNGRRFVPTVPPSSVGHPYQVDINLIPSLVIDRMEVVTGGASAQWGSDAVAGVVNMILKTKFDGIEVSGQSGFSQRGDGVERRLGFIAGTSFNNGRGNVVISGDHIKNNGIRLYSSREWADRGCYYFNDPASTVANGLPKQFLACDKQAGNRAPGGLIVSATGGTTAQRAALVGLQFNSATEVAQFDRGKYNPYKQTVSGSTTSQTFAATQSGGSNPDQEKVSLLPVLKRSIFYGHFDYQLTDNVTAFVEGTYGKSTGFISSRPPRDQGGVFNPATGTGTQVRFYADNAYIPAVLRGDIPLPAGPVSTTPPAGGQSFVMSRNSYDLPQPNTSLTDEAWTVSTGLNGDIGGGWRWDASYVHGQNDYIRSSLARDRERYALAADAVTDPVSGKIVCRSTLTDPTNGCVPVNLFGPGSPSAAAVDYFQFDATALVRYKQDAAQFNVTGSPFATWAGDVALAAGMEWRHESANSTVDERSERGVWESSVGSSFVGKFSVVEGYLESTVPLAKDLPFAHSLAVNGAVRVAKYSGDASAAGEQTTWKVGATWEPTDDLLFRAVRSLDIRAPSLFELKVPPVFSQQNISYAGRQFTGVRIANSGSLDLVPEKSKTFTVGGTYRPSFVQGLNLSVDYYDIKVNDVIAALGGASIARNCEAGLVQYCSLLVLDPTTQNLLQINDQYLNLSSFSTSGIDFTMSYATPFLGGELALRGAATYVDHFTIVTPNDPPIVLETAGQNATNSDFAVPHWKATATISYQQDPFSLGLQVRYVGPGKVDTALKEFATATAQPDVSPADNRISSYFVFNLSGSFNIADSRFQLFWNIDNLFDRNPPLAPNLNSELQTNGAIYDVLGRYFKVGAKVRF
jgi:outer membrane receptor protein involved in Fe transport